MEKVSHPQRSKDPKIDTDKSSDRGEPSMVGKSLSVAFIDSDAAMAGVEWSTLFTTQHLNKALWKPMVICPSEGDLPRACRSSNIPVHILSRPAVYSTSILFDSGRMFPNPIAWAINVVTIFVAALRLARLLTRVRPDVVVTKGMFSHFYGGLAARLVRIPCVWHVQDLISDRFGGVYRRVFSLLARWLPDHVIVDGRAIALQLTGSGHERVSIILNGVNTNQFRRLNDCGEVRSELGIDEGAFVIGHVARMAPLKGQRYLLEAFAQFAREEPRSCLLFVGSPVFETDAYQRSLRQQASTLRLSDRVFFAGYRHDLPRVFAAMDIFAFTSLEKETSPLALLSAMSCGLPIAAFDIEGVEELSEGNREFLTVPVGQTQALSIILLRLISDEGLRFQLGKSARQLAERRFTLERYITQVEEVLLKVARRTRSAFMEHIPSVDHQAFPKTQDCV